jgi:hypothetical protein
MADLTILDDVSADVRSAQVAVFAYFNKAGEKLNKFSPCRVDDDGMVYMSDSTVCTISGISDFIGFNCAEIASGDPVTLYGKGLRIASYAEVTPGAMFYVSNTAGALSDAKVAANDTPVAIAISTSDLLVLK